MIKIEEITTNKAEICRAILEALPDRFGNQRVVELIVKEAPLLSMLGARDGDDYVGMMTVKRQTPQTIEIRALGVMPDRHRQGIGRALIQEVESYAIQQGAVLLSLKTVGPSDPNPIYQNTRAFYDALGFIQVEELPLWGPDAACLLMVKSLRT